MPNDAGQKLGGPQGIVGRAVVKYQPNNVFAAVSGGNDSTVLLAEVRDMIDGVVHINTGIGIEETRQYVRDLCQSWNLPLIEMHPPDKTYRDLVLEYGFPGPAAHIYAYSWLKERALRNVRRQYGPKVMLLTGVRKAESRIRMGRVQEVYKDGNTIWVAPIMDYGLHEMAATRERFSIPVKRHPRHHGQREDTSMTAKNHNCFSIACDECGDPYKGYEDEFTVHYDNPEEFVAEMRDYEGEENEWRIEGTNHYCPPCSCKRETGHALTFERGQHRYCRCGSNWSGRQATA